MFSFEYVIYTKFLLIKKKFVTSAYPDLQGFLDTIITVVIVITVTVTMIIMTIIIIVSREM